MARRSENKAIYEIALNWKNRCLLDNRSLLWPDEITWTPENLDRLFFHFVESLETGSESFLDKLKRQLDGEPIAIHRIATDAVAIYCLFPSKGNMSQARKLQLVSTVSSWKAGPPPLLDSLETAYLDGLGSAGMHYMNAGRHWQFAYIVNFGRLAHAESFEDTPEEIRVIADRAQDFLASHGGTAIAARNAILHLLVPEFYEPIASRDHKSRIAAAFRQPDDPVDVDEAIWASRQRLASKLGQEDFHFYQADVRPMWDGPQPANPPRSTRDESLDDPTTVNVETAIGELSDRTSITTGELREIESLIRSKRQIIFEGPPGSGKTYVARLFARYLAGLPLDAESDERVEIVQFHQSYGYEDFVAGIRPVTNENGQLTYRSQPGIFVEMCERAASRPDETFVLIIDEINRGNLSRIFGELLYALEYRDQPVRLQTPVEVDGRTIPHLQIPPNFYLIGTMNSTDRSLAMIDYALRRRFYFWRLMPTTGSDAPVLRQWLAQQVDLTSQDRSRLIDAFVALNANIAQTLGEDFQVGHSYLMLPGGAIGDPAALERVWRHAIEPLLREYFHTSPNASAIVDGLRAGFLQLPVEPEVFESSSDLEP